MKTKACSPVISFVMFCITATTLASAALDWQRLPNQHGNLGLPSTADGELQGRNFQMGWLSAVAKSPSALPIPGVYKTEPYACIVVVPDKCPDDRSMVAPAECGFAMPVIKPIRIIVKNGNATLEGVVNSEGDKNIVNIRAHGVHGVFSVTNNLRVEQ